MRGFILVFIFLLVQLAAASSPDQPSFAPIQQPKTGDEAVQVFQIL